MTDLTQLNPGDRVRITVEGEVKDPWCDGHVAIVFDGCDDQSDFNLISEAELTAPTARVELLKPPVDPDLLLARKWFKGRYPKHAAREIDDGRWDDISDIVGFLAGLKAAKAGGKA